MKLYLAFHTSVTMMEGSSEQLLGVFDSIEKALQCLQKHYSWSSHRKTKVKYQYRDIVDGTYTSYLEIEEIELNKGRYED